MVISGLFRVKSSADPPLIRYASTLPVLGAFQVNLTQVASIVVADRSVTCSGAETRVRFESVVSRVDSLTFYLVSEDICLFIIAELR